MGCCVECLAASWWWIFGVAFSAFWSIRSCCLFTKEYRDCEKFWWGSYQFILNFSCSFAGWICLHILELRFMSVGHVNQLSWADFALFLLALLGVTGSLPQFLVKLPEAIVKATKS